MVGNQMTIPIAELEMSWDSLTIHRRRQGHKQLEASWIHTGLASTKSSYCMFPLLSSLGKEGRGRDTVSPDEIGHIYHKISLRQLEAR